MTLKKSEYERVSARAARGDYQLAEPIDYLIMSFLPDEGEVFAGLFPLGETVTNLRKKFTPEQQKLLTSTMISSRLRVLKEQGLAVAVYAGQSSRGKIVWQRTPEAIKLVNKWKDGHESNGG